VLTSTGNKSLSVPITVTTRLVRGGTSNLVLGSNTLTYDPGAAIEYAGTAAQITGPELPANIGGLVIANSAGATLTANTTVNTLLDLASGDLATGAFTLDLGAGATCSGSGDVLGATRRSTVAPGSTYCFGHPDVHAGVNAGSTAPTTLTVTLARGSAPFTAAVLRQYVVVAPGFSGVATLRLHYRTDELNGNSADDLVLWRHDGVRWIAQTPSAAGSGYVEKNDVTTFSDWAMAADGGSTAVDVSTFAAQQAGDQVLLTWSTASEVDVAGFHLHRSASVDGARERITASLIPARASGQVAGAAYEWTTPTSGGSWHFWLETVHLQGASTWHGPAPMKARRVYLPVISGKQP
jgi:hypothetical protein